MLEKKQLECRIVIKRLEDRRIKLGMYCPYTYRYEFLGYHGPSNKDIDKAILNLKRTIEDAGHRVTFSDRYGEE